MASNFSHPFTKALNSYRQFRRKLPVLVSNMAANTFKDNFKRQGYEADGGGVVKWKKRKTNKTARDKGRAILVKTGRLRRGIMPVPTYNYARVINRVPYSERLNKGFKGVEHVKAHKRYKWKHTKTKIKVNGKNKTLKQSSRTNVIRVKAHTRKVNLVARPFMITTKPLLHRIDYMVELNLKKIFK